MTLRLAAWTEDDLLEYLLARHRSQCGAILGRLRGAGDAWRLEGVPELYAITLDYLARQPAGLPARDALLAAFFEKLDAAKLGDEAEADAAGAKES